MTSAPDGPQVVSTTAIAEVGSLVGDPGRANMLISLLDGRALTARELADRAGVTAQTASGHLAKLIDGGLIRMERQGRHHYHRLASTEVARMLESMHVAGAQTASQRQPLRTGPRDPGMREARSCYDHLAGRIAVALADSLAACTEPEGLVELTARAQANLADWGLDMGQFARGRRPLCRPCLDWSERRPHLAGEVGAAILSRSLELGWLRRREGSRSLIVTPTGRAGFARRFSVPFPS